MTTSVLKAPGNWNNSNPGLFSNAVTLGQLLLNLVTEAAGRAADRSRFAGMPARYLDDVGMTRADIEAATERLAERPVARQRRRARRRESRA